jgi:hypothetical protein
MGGIMADDFGSDSLIGRFCKGQDKDLREVFRRIACEQYEEVAVFCRALLQGRISDMFRLPPNTEQLLPVAQHGSKRQEINSDSDPESRKKEFGRCLLILKHFIDEEITKTAFKNPDLYVKLKEDTEDIDFAKLKDKIIRALSKKPFERTDLPSWYAYLKKTAENRIQLVLIKFGLAAAERRCGSCLHLPRVRRSDSARCQQQQFVQEGRLVKNEYYGEVKKRSSLACEGFEFGLFRKDRYVDAEAKHDSTPGDDLAGLYHGYRGVQAEAEIGVMREKLLNRANWAPEGSKRKEKFLRQLTLFDSLYRRLRKDVTFKQAFKEILDLPEHEQDRPNIQKQMSRDWDEIVAFLIDKNSNRFLQ